MDKVRCACGRVIGNNLAGDVVCGCGHVTAMPADPRHSPPTLGRYVASDFARKDEVALVTCHFNPLRYNRLRDTYFEWVGSLGPLRSRLEVLELVFDDDEPEIPGSTVIRGTRAANLIWQKEALIDAARKRLPPHIRYFGWLDHDLISTDPDWLSHAVDQIDAGAVAVQLFDEFVLLKLNRMVDTRLRGGVAAMQLHGDHSGSPGGLWLANRAFIDRVGLPYANIVGGGDQAWFHGLLTKSRGYLEHYSPALRASDEAWITRAEAVRGERTAGFIPAPAYHLWHGDRKGRQYRARTDILLANEFDPATDVVTNDAGILEWAGNKPMLAEQVREYFSNRNEDGEHTRAVQHDGDGPGTRLHATIPSIFQHPGCGCAAFARQMDRWGDEGCRERFDEICDYIMAKAEKTGFASVTPRPLMRTAIRRWVKTAIGSVEERREKQHEWVRSNRLLDHEKRANCSTRLVRAGSEDSGCGLTKKLGSGRDEPQSSAIAQGVSGSLSEKDGSSVLALSSYIRD